jgi:hypothetical protein
MRPPKDRLRKASGQLFEEFVAGRILRGGVIESGGSKWRKSDKGLLMGVSNGWRRCSGYPGRQDRFMDVNKSIPLDSFDGETETGWGWRSR